MSPRRKDQIISEDGQPQEGMVDKTMTADASVSTAQPVEAKASNDPILLEPGDEVSLNLRQQSMIMFPLPGGKIFRLTHREWSQKIPANIEPKWLTALQRHLSQGDIIKGKKYLPRFPKNPEILKKFYRILEAPIAQVVAKLKPLVLHKGLVEGYRATEIIILMMKYEQEHYHRKQYIDLLQEALDHIGGTGPITQSPVQNISMNDVENLTEDLG